MRKTTFIKRENTNIKGSLHLFLFLLSFLAIQTYSQDKSAGLWTGVELEKDITKWLEAKANLEVRLDNNISTAERYLADFGLRSDLGKYVDAALFYRYTYRYFPEYNWASYNRIYGEVRFNYDYMAFSFYERFRMTFDEIPRFMDDGFVETTARLKTQATYNIRKTPLRARGSVEFFHPVSGTINPVPEKIRYKLGIIYKINASVSAEAGHMFQKVSVRGKPQNNYIWVVTLAYTL